MTTLEFSVIGDPGPQGSKRHIGGGRMIESSAKVKPWRTDVEWAACVAARKQGWALRQGALEVTIMFSLPAPQTMPKGRTRPSVRPDVDKLIRSTFDAITACRHIWRDDSQVVRVAASKWYAPAGAATGARITISDEVV